nr:quinoprotein dehydrogenase-associated SoxYZ-like carrier [Granulosicoccus sp.]
FRNNVKRRFGSSYLKTVVLLGLSVGLALAAAIHSTATHAATGKPLAEIVGEERWENLKDQLFGDQPIDDTGGVVLLQIPGRALDGARVPLTVRALVPQSADSYIEKLYLIVDNNPLPVAGTFTFEPNQGWDTIDTEIRLNEYSSTRAVVQMNDGSLFMDSSFVKASGGCSAPPSSYERSDANLLGKISGGVSPLLDPEVPAAARIRIVHPNASGMQFDQFTRTYIQPHYVHTMVAEFNGETLFKLETNFSLSQDPVLGFNFTPQEDGELLIYALDSKDQRFEQSWPIVGGGATN